jgi:nickel-dependent lactate racemase
MTTAPRRLSLRYGQGHHEFLLPAHADVLDIRESAHTVNRASFLAGLQERLPSSLPRGLIAIVVADKTRLCGYPQVLPWLIETLRQRGKDPAQIVLYIAYGTHAPQSEAESLAAYGPIWTQYPCIHHQCTEQDRFVELGRTSRGTPVRIRKELCDAGLIITVGAISHHYFAGFGGGRKLLFPGLGEQEAIYSNHRLFLDTELQTLAPGCRPGQMTGNPVAEDLAEIDRMLPPYLAIHGLLDSHGQVAAFRFGSSYNDFLAVCREHDALYRARTDRQYPLVLSSAGGYPKDINVIQAHKAIDNGAAFVRDNGRLILLAECADGVGSTTFLPYFALGSREAAFAHLATHYTGNGGTALAMMSKIERIRIQLVTDLSPAICRQIGVECISAAEAAEVVRAAGEMAVIVNGSMLIR